MPAFTINVNGPRKIEAINQARAVYNAEQTAIEAAKTPPGAAVSLTREQYLQMVIDSAVRSWRTRFSAEIDAALAPAETAQLAAAQAAVAAVAGAPDAP